MMLRLLAICLLGCFSAQQPLAADSPHKLPSDYLSTIRIIVRCEKGGGLGTGFAIDGKHAITAKHVITCDDDKAPILIMATDVHGNTYALKLDKVSKEHDLAKVVIDEKLNPSTTAFPLFDILNFQDYNVGDVVCTVTGDNLVFMTRRCGEIIPSRDNYAMLISVRVVPGNSGSALRDSYGYVIGIITRGIWGGDNENIGYVIPIKYVKDIL